MREALVKACAGHLNQWPEKVPQTLFADNITTSRATGTSAFYLLHGVHPVLPFDLSEATFMVDGFYSGMSSSDLLALRIRQLDKRPEDLMNAAQVLKKARFKSKEQFERKFRRRLRREMYEEGDLVLARNTRVEKELNRKTKPRYLGPFEVVRRTKGGSYVLREMDGTISRRGIAAFRLLPYITRDYDLLRQISAFPDNDNEQLEEENEEEDSALDDDLDDYDLSSMDEDN
ncbi:hypothetical protein BV22DRAFT_1026794 [Leucogyrophana mollusca]|uniref:Uncharacterized protein n=1 Tax=Leucogyrophana mollusca TaxID=85980 RepID=A0ACB8AW79_9AGAM|nr:hypothetical protein BV22DRAFT_1026794 [Leucogyrophana mollusca]